MARRLWIEPGQKVRFDPRNMDTRGCSEEDRCEVIGTVVKVYPEHKWFSVVYGDHKQRTSFKFCDVGERVKFVG